jgi:hypothetical protein
LKVGLRKDQSGRLSYDEPHVYKEAPIKIPKTELGELNPWRHL